MLSRAMLMAAATVAVCFGWYAWRIGAGSWATEAAELGLVRTETFTMLAMCQWFNLLNCQSAQQFALRLGLLQNPWLLGGLMPSVALQAAMLWAPPLQAMFHTQALSLATLGLLLALASVVLWTEEWRKLLSRSLVKRSQSKKCLCLTDPEAEVEVDRTQRHQVSLLTLMVGNFDEKSLALSAILTATERATAL